MRVPYRTLSLCLLALFVAGCSRVGPVSSGSAQAAQAPPLAKPNETNDIARFLAGLPGRPESALKPLEATQEWKDYADQFQKTWDRSYKEQFQPIDKFRKTELEPIHTGSDYLFYPFSGPDVLYMDRFFPNYKTYVMVALEPVGTIRKPADYDPEHLKEDLHLWAVGLSSIFNRSFFVTGEMDHHFRRKGEVSDGLLETMILLLARSGHSIENIQYGHLTPDGKFEFDPPEMPGKHMGVEVTFLRDGDHELRKLYYFSTHLDAEFEKNPALSSFLKKLGRSDTMVKSASFLLHWAMCNGIRKQILDNSNLILQDDSGVPYRYFTQGGWKVQLYGKYSAPDKPFVNQVQKDLAEAFEDRANVRPMGFPLGYGFKRRTSSLILAMRRVPPQTATAPAKSGT